jgi:hypothetical protein
MPGQPSENTISDELRTEILAEYSALRAEILKRMEMREQLLSFTLVIAGTFLSLGAQEGVSALILLIYPVLAVFLAMVWKQNDTRVWEIGEYIRVCLEAKGGGKSGLDGLRWENILRDARPFRAEKIISAGGVFIAADLLALVIAILRLTFSVEVAVLLACDLLAIILTITVLLRYSKIDEYLQDLKSKGGC